MTRFRLGLSGCSGGLESTSTSTLLDLAIEAETLGYEAIWLNEDHFQGGGDDGRRCLSPLILASAILDRTSRLRVGFSVLLPGLHHPLRLAGDLASLDVLSDGRVDIGVSRGANPRYLSAFAVPEQDTSFESFVERIDFLRSAWSSAPLPGSGVQVEPKPAQQPHSPFYIGTYTPDTAAWAAQQGHRIILPWHQQPAGDPPAHACLCRSRRRCRELTVRTVRLCERKRRKCAPRIVASDPTAD